LFDQLVARFADIPQYESAEQAEEKIHYAIANTRTMDTDYHPRGEQFDLDQ
jgi:hypothetical protein